MRQGQQHNKNRSRGRGGGGNRGGGGGGRQSNPLNRVFESNGPDVKVRGNAQTIADKYLQLARDAVSSGENVNAENYFQHAEHYLRIVAAAQAFNQQNQQAQQAQQAQQRRDDGDGDTEAASGGDSDNKQASAGEEGGQENSRQNNRRNNRGQRGNGRQRPAADDQDATSGSEEAQPAAASEGDENWQAQAPDFLRREAGDRDGNADSDGDDAPVEAKPKRQPRARKAKPKPVEVADAADGAGPSDDDAAAEDISAA
ncbi:MAG: DUF4167 domain-containing protein [Pseudomonadota bacterium]